MLIDEDCEDLPTDELPDAIDKDFIESEILDLWSPLLETRGSPASTARNHTVHLAHFTIREFLVGRLPARVSQNEALRASNEHIQNTILVRLCPSYLQSRQTWRDAANIHGSPIQIALGDYAAASWHAHVKSRVLLEQDRHIGTCPQIPEQVPILLGCLKEVAGCAL